MAANPRIRKALFDKLGLTQPGFSRHVKRFRQRLPITYEDAIYVLAHLQGVDLGRELDPETLSRVAGYVSQVRGGSAPASVKTERRPATAKQILVQIAGIDVGQVPGMTLRHAQEARVMAEKVYPILYVFENSARDVISRVLVHGIGDDWWDRIVPERPYRSEVAKRMKKEGKEAWHSRRSRDPLQFVDLPWLVDIVHLPDAWPHFESLFPRRTWFDSVVDDLNVSRRVLAHMNPISADDIKSVENGFRKWVKQLQAKEAELP